LEIFGIRNSTSARSIVSNRIFDEEPLSRIQALDVGSHGNAHIELQRTQRLGTGVEVKKVQAALFDIDKAQRVGRRLVVGPFAQGALDVEKWLRDGEKLKV